MKRMLPSPFHFIRIIIFLFTLCTYRCVAPLPPSLGLKCGFDPKILSCYGAFDISEQRRPTIWGIWQLLKSLPHLKSPPKSLHRTWGFDTLDLPHYGEFDILVCHIPTIAPYKPEGVVGLCIDRCVTYAPYNNYIVDNWYVSIIGHLRYLALATLKKVFSLHNLLISCFIWVAILGAWVIFGAIPTYSTTVLFDICNFVNVMQLVA